MSTDSGERVIAYPDVLSTLMLSVRDPDVILLRKSSTVSTSMGGLCEESNEEGRGGNMAGGGGEGKGILGFWTLCEDGPGVEDGLLSLLAAPALGFLLARTALRARSS
jgi:hypothetical protein